MYVIYCACMCSGQCRPHFQLETADDVEKRTSELGAFDSAASHNIIRSLQAELKTLREELAATKKALADTQRDLDSTRAALAQRAGPTTGRRE